MKSKHIFVFPVPVGKLMIIFWLGLLVIKSRQSSWYCLTDSTSGLLLNVSPTRLMSFRVFINCCLSYVLSETFPETIIGLRCLDIVEQEFLHRNMLGHLTNVIESFLSFCDARNVETVLKDI